MPRFYVIPAAALGIPITADTVESAVDGLRLFSGTEYVVLPVDAEYDTVEVQSTVTNKVVKKGKKTA